MLWGGYNTGLWYVLDPAFPSSDWELVHGLRAFLPLLAGWLAILAMLARQNLPPGAIEGPLGFLAFYALIGVASSLLLSNEQFQATYWALAFGSVVLVLMSTLSDADPVRSVSSLVTLSWIIAVVMMLAILVALPHIGGPSLAPGENNPLSAEARRGGFVTADIVGMAGTRNTGLARYAAVAGLAGLGRLWRGGLFVRGLWFLVLVVSGYSLVVAQGRTAMIGFVAGSFVILALARRRRLLLLIWTPLAIVLMWSGGVFERLWVYGTRTGEFDPTLSGRTVTWQQGWELFKQSPWIGFGGQADRYYLEGQHMHDALLHALVQTGLLGTIPFVLAFVIASVLVARLYFARRPHGGLALLDEVPGFLVFFAIVSITESTAYFSSNWLFCAPVLAYLQLMAWQQRVARASASRALRMRVRLSRPRLAAPSQVSS
jgi:O-antigen ligase